MTRMRAALGVVLATAVSVTACSDDTDVPGTTFKDTGTAMVFDFGLSDTGAVSGDSGTVDDSGVTADLGSDSGIVADTGTANDSGSPSDLGGTPGDTGTDAGFDSGVAADAGSDGGVVVSDMGTGVIDMGAGDAGVGDLGVDSGVADAGPGLDGGTGDAGAAVQAPSTFNATQVATAYATAICRNQTRCSPAYYAFYGTPEATCISDIVQQLSGYYAAVASAISAGNITYSSSQLQACLNAQHSNSCSDGVLPSTCDFLAGNVSTGGSCALTDECGSSAWCSVTTVGGCGTCVARAADGASCAASLCDEDSSCLDVGGAATCVNVNLSAGATCGTVATGLCRGSNECIGNASGTTYACTAVAGLGQSCSDTGLGNPYCDINQSLSCVSGTCATGSWNAAGGSCSPPNFCNADSYCSGTTCAALPGAGQSCLSIDCQNGLVCNSSFVCQTPVSLGGTCSTSSDCVDGLVCGSNSTCQAWSYPTCGGGSTGDAGVSDMGGADAGVAMDAGASDGGTGTTSCTSASQCSTGQSCLDLTTLAACAGGTCQCFDTCDAFASSTSCAASEACYWSGGNPGSASGICITDQGGSGQGVSCTATFDASGNLTGSTCNAAQNFYCAGAAPGATSGVCTRICDASTNALCSSLQTGNVCEAAAGQSVGLCRNSPPSYTDIGSSCTSGANCQSSLCSSDLGFLCSASCAGLASCPTGSTCVGVGTATICGRDCTTGTAGDAACAALATGSVCTSISTTTNDGVCYNP